MNSYLRKITADSIYPISSSPVNSGVVVVDNKGCVVDLISPNNSEYASALESSEKFNGIICPGFVNTHCHLELSYLKGKVSPHTGLNGFITQLQKNRNEYTEAEILIAIETAEKEMIKNGIVAVGDICNGLLTLNQKQQNNLVYHSFVELFGFDSLRAEEIFNTGQSLYTTIENKGLQASLTPHAPYSTSEKLMRLIAEHCVKHTKIQSIHNQESEDENKLFQSKSGKMADMLKQFGYDLGSWKNSEKRSLPTYYPYLKSQMNTLLVHNTYTSAEDIAKINSDHVFWCFCPNANLFIENRLPDIPLFINANCKITLGTDSLASNNELSILSEIKTIQAHYPEIEFESLLKWATLNGANYMCISEKYGSIEKGKSPGLNLIQNATKENATVSKIL